MKRVRSGRPASTGSGRGGSRFDRPSVHGAPRRRSRERGVALIIAVVAIAILTTVAVDFAYNSRVDLQLAANQRDEMRAHYLSRSGIAMSRLLLRFQKQLDGLQLPNLGSMISQFTGGSPAAPGLPTPGALKLQLWRMARVDCHMLQGMVPTVEGSGVSDPKFGFDDEPTEGVEGTEVAPKRFGGFEGCFLAEITNEDEKLNVNALGGITQIANAAGLSALQLFGDERYEFLWQTDDAHGVRVTPQDMLIHLRDWIDPDEVASSVNLTGQGRELFVNGFSDENAPYSRYTPRYEVKNARFDTVDELYLVHGVSDRFMAAFRDRLTVYSDVNEGLNVNTDDPLMLWLAVLAILPESELRTNVQLQNPVFQESVIRQIRAARMFPGLAMSVKDFAAIVTSLGLPVDQRSVNGTSGTVGDESSTFRIRSTGEAGQVQRTIETVVRLDDKLGRLMYWREE